MTKIEISPFVGQHCETTATGTLLRQLGFELSEPMLFGLGQGLGFVYWNMKSMDFPFIGGRIKQGELTVNLAKNLNLRLDRKETTSVRKAWETAKAGIDEGAVVGLQLDSFHLEYFPEKFHFAGHFAALHGYDGDYAYLVDTQPNGSLVRTSLERLALARNEKGPMAAKNLSYRLHRSEREADLTEAVIAAIAQNAEGHLTPAISNLGYKGVQKTSVEVVKWFRSSENRAHEFGMCAMLMERAGTGGALFRNLYRDFLQEAAERTNRSKLEEAHRKFIPIAQHWTEVAALFEVAGMNDDEAAILKVSALLKDLSRLEYEALTPLVDLA